MSARCPHCDAAYRAADQLRCGACGQSRARYIVQRHPDGRRYEVIEPATLTLCGNYYRLDKAEEAAQQLNSEVTA